MLKAASTVAGSGAGSESRVRAMGLRYGSISLAGGLLISENGLLKPSNENWSGLSPVLALNSEYSIQEAGLSWPGQYHSKRQGSRVCGSTYMATWLEPA